MKAHVDGTYFINDTAFDLPPIHQFQQAGNLTNSKSLSKFKKKLF